ncbi:MAG: hypothetical protein CML60_09830 [Rhodobacteraceae bacterium]|nr:hypothetical protein [Paracoccaceae bacterium]
MELKLFNITTVKTNFPEADFWLIRKGSFREVGRPTREYHPERIGIKVDQPQIVLSDYLFYVLTALHGIGYFERRAKGTLSLKHITVNDVEQIKLGERR